VLYPGTDLRLNYELGAWNGQRGAQVSRHFPLSQDS
jgi:hypothetical protein